MSIYQDLTAAIKGNDLGNGVMFTSSGDGTLIESSAGWDGAVLLIFCSMCNFERSVKPVCTCSFPFYSSSMPGFSWSFINCLLERSRRLNPRPDGENNHWFASVCVLNAVFSPLRLHSNSGLRLTTAWKNHLAAINGWASLDLYCPLLVKYWKYFG